MHVLVVPAVKLVVKGATAMGLGRIVSGVVMTNTPIQTRTQLYLVRVATVGLTSLATKHVSDHMDEQIDAVVDLVKNRDGVIKVALEKKDEVVAEVKEAVVETLSDVEPLDADASDKPFPPRAE